MKRLVISGLFVLSILVFRVSAASIRQDCVLDVVFAVDGSTSLREEEFIVMLNFVITMINDFPTFGQNRTDSRAALIKFSTTNTTRFELDEYSNKGDAIAAVNTTVFDGGLTYIDLAIDSMRDILDRQGRDHAKKIGLMITDGEATDHGKAVDAANKFKDQGYLMAIVGIGAQVDKESLKSMASDTQLFKIVNDIDSLKILGKQLTDVFCASTPTTTTTTPTTTTTTTTPSTTTTTPTTTTTASTKPSPVTPQKYFCNGKRYNQKIKFCCGKTILKIVGSVRKCCNKNRVYHPLSLQCCNGMIRPITDDC